MMATFNQTMLDIMSIAIGYWADSTYCFAFKGYTLYPDYNINNVYARTPISSACVDFISSFFELIIFECINIMLKNSLLLTFNLFYLSVGLKILLRPECFGFWYTLEDLSNPLKGMIHPRSNSWLYELAHQNYRQYQFHRKSQCSRYDSLQK